MHLIRAQFCSYCLIAGLGLGMSAASGQMIEQLEPVVLQLPESPRFEFAGYYAAQAEGYFKGEGLTVEIRAGGMGVRPVAEVTGGAAQYGVEASALIVARLRGAPVVLVSSVFQHSSLALAVLSRSGIAMPADLQGKRVALDPHGSTPEIQAMLLAGGLTSGQYTTVPDEWGIGEIEIGAAEAMVIDTWQAEQEFKPRGVAVQLIRPSDHGVDFYGDSLFTSETEALKNPQRVEAMRRAVMRGWQRALANPEEIIRWMRANLPDQSSPMQEWRLRAEAVETAALINANLISIGHINPERWAQLAGLVVRTGLATDAHRLKGFIYNGTIDQIPAWGKWLFGIFSLAVGLTFVAFLANRRLHRLVESRTRALRESEATQREFFDLAPVPIVIENYAALEPMLARLAGDGVTDLRRHLRTNADLRDRLFKMKRVVAANRRALTRTGYKSVEEMDRNLADVMTPQAMETFVEELVAVWNKVDRLTIEKTYRSKNGETIHTLINWEIGRIGDVRDLTRVRLVFTEITDLKTAEQALRESEARYRLFFEQSPLPIAEYDYTKVFQWFTELRTAGVTDLAAHQTVHPEIRTLALQKIHPLGINHTAIRLLGITSAQEFMEKQTQFYTESLYEVRWHNVLLLWQGENHSDGEFQLRKVDGSLHTIRFHWRVILDGSNPSPTRRTQTVMVDITEQRQAEVALRESETRYRELFERAVGGIYRSSPEGRFLTLNPAMARVFGFETPAQMIAWTENNPGIFFYTKPGRREEFTALISRNHFVNDFESEIRLRDGSSSWISENARAVRDRQAKLLYYEGFVTDITARRRLEAEMTRASKLEAVGILAGGIAHDFNNILTVVLGNLALAEMDTAPGDSIRQMLTNAKNATLRARDLTLQLLTFAKGGEPIRTAIDLPELLRESAGFALHGSKARCEFKIDENLWPANADKGQVGQVVQNLVINAVQAMPEGGIVTITAANTVQLASHGEQSPIRPGRHVFIAVTDTGVGIAPENLVKIFDPYFTTKNQGSGLGLATVYSIIKKHQGHIEVESVAGKGSTFRLWLPAASETPPVQPEEATARPVALRTRVLFMDDEAPIRDMALMFMKRLGAECDVAADGKEAVEKFRQVHGTNQAFNVVVMDLTVPGGMGGREALEKMREIDPQVRAIVSSGYSQDPVLANHSAHGFKGILPKPYSLDQLIAAMQSVLAVSESQKPS